MSQPLLMSRLSEDSGCIASPTVDGNSNTRFRLLDAARPSFIQFSWDRHHDERAQSQSDLLTSIRELHAGVSMGSETHVPWGSPGGSLLPAGNLSLRGRPWRSRAEP